MKRRVFIAINATDPLFSTFPPTLKKLKINADRREMSVKWAPLDNYHVTISFLGEKSMDEIQEIRWVLETVCKETLPFELKIEDMGAFSNEHAARVLWLGVQNKKDLGYLKNRIEKSLDEKNLYPVNDENFYQPHLTIGRLRSPGSVKDMISPFKRKSFGKIQVSEVVLYESKIQGPFPVYIPLAKFKLAGEERLLESEPFESVEIA